MPRNKFWGYSIPFMLILPVFLVGCTGITPAPKPHAILTVTRDEVNLGEPITLHGDESKENAGVLTEWRWDFGDGNYTTTTSGFTSYHYSKPGNYLVTMTIENTEGGTDSATVMIFVNGPPTISLEMPNSVKVGEDAILDASGSSDVELGILTWNWEFFNDDVVDGNADIAYNEDKSIATLSTTSSGTINGTLTLTDDKGSASSKDFSLVIMTRNWKLTWELRTITPFEFSGQLSPGEEWNHTNVPGVDGIIYSVNATLKLNQQDGNPLGDENFTLHLYVPVGSWSADSKATRPFQNIDLEAKAYIERSEMNSVSTTSVNMTSDSTQEIIDTLLPTTSFGYGDWRWKVTYDSLNDDWLIDTPLSSFYDNQWSLEIQFEIYYPVFVELN